MRLLTVFSHPRPDRYPAAVMDAFHEPARAAGVEVDVLDLHAEGFDPRFTDEDHAHFWGGPVPDDVAAMHRRVEGADRLAFVFPVYWWSMPALLKGWIDRVFTPGWAYQYGDGVEDRGKKPVRGLLPRVPTTLLGIAGADVATYERYGYDEAMRAQLDVGIFAYCGITDVETHLVYDVEGDHNGPARERGLEIARGVGARFLAADRVPRDARVEHLTARGAAV